MGAATPPTAVLVSLLRLGEQSAELAFDRLSRSAALGATDPYRGMLARVAAEEHRHDRELAAVTGHIPRLRMSGAVRRFFIGLRDRDIRVHLSRIAALDACVCQIITQVLSCSLRSPAESGLRMTLAGIRQDEGRHVRISRRAALRYGASDGLMREMDLQTRSAFCAVLERHAEDFQSLGVNAGDLLCRLSRATP